MRLWKRSRPKSERIHLAPAEIDGARAKPGISIQHANQGIAAEVLSAFTDHQLHGALILGKGQSEEAVVQALEAEIRNRQARAQAR